METSCVWPRVQLGAPGLGQLPPRARKPLPPLRVSQQDGPPDYLDFLSAAW